MIAPPSELETRRLAFIRLVYRLGIEQSGRPEPVAVASILTFHDVVELFLYLAMTHLGAEKKQPSFMEYWELLDAKLHPDRLGHKEAMRKLNAVRGALKHQGVLPAKAEIEIARANTSGFLDESTRLIFGVDFRSISLLDLVVSEPVRVFLRRSQDASAAGEMRGAMLEVASAFACLLHTHDLRTRPGIYGEPLGVGSSRLRDLGQPYSVDRELRPAFSAIVEAHNALIDTVQALQETTLINALGIDYHPYIRFKTLTPAVGPKAFDRQGNILEYYPVAGPTPEGEPSTDAWVFCFDFVIESALRLQQ